MPSEPVHRFAAAGTIVSSTIDLPGHLPAPDGDVRWHIDRRTLPLPESGRAYHVWRHDNGRPWLRFFREGADRRLVFPGLLDVLVSDARREACCDFAPRRSTSQLQQLVAHHVLPLLLGADRLVLHASAAAIDGEVVAFVGTAGAGKSTLASYLATRGAADGTRPRRAVQIVADDAVVMDEGRGPVSVVPYASPMRLWCDSIAEVVGRPADQFRAIGAGATAKRAVPAAVATARALRLRGVYVVTPSRRGRCALGDLSKADAIRVLMTAAFDMTLDEPLRLARTFDRVARIVGEVPVKRLRLRHAYGRLPEAAALILADVASAETSVNQAERTLAG